jgi:DNA-binding transcriptional MerR regulator
MPETERSLSLKDMLAGSGCTPRTVRFYEREGLLRAKRTRGGHRAFSPVELDRLNFIVALREAGWSLEEIARLLGTRETAGSAREAARELDQTLSVRIGELERKLELLTRLRGDLEATRKALAVCTDCTQAPADPARCNECTRLPQLAELPRGFRLTWRDDG